MKRASCRREHNVSIDLIMIKLIVVLDSYLTRQISLYLGLKLMETRCRDRNFL